MLDFENILVLTQKELYDARRNRWFTLYAVAFTGLALGLAYMALSGAGNYGLAGFGQNQCQPHQPRPAHRAADGADARRTQSGR